MKFVDDVIADTDALDVNITPLIDVVFILLIFFMVTTTFVESQGLQVKLPESSQQKTPPQEEKPLVVTIAKTGDVTVDGKQVSLPDLRKQIASYRAGVSSPALVVRADREADHGDVVAVMDAAQQEGVSKIAIATDVAPR